MLPLLCVCVCALGWAEQEAGSYLYLQQDLAVTQRPAVVTLRPLFRVQAVWNLRESVQTIWFCVICSVCK